MKVANIASRLESRVFQLNGTSLHVVLAGPATGKRLILLHGFPEFWFAWRAQIDHFVSLGYRGIIPDQRGYNLSDKPSGIVNYSIDLLAADIVGLVDKVAVSKAFVVGHDVGGAVTWYLLARYPDRFTRAAISGAPHFRVFLKNLVTNPAQVRKSCYVLFFQFPWLPEILLRRKDWKLLLRALQNTVPAGVFSDSDLEMYRESWSKAGSLTAMLNWYRAPLLHSSKLELDAEASRAKTPLLLIWGKQDSFTAVTMAHESLAYCDVGSLEIIDGATHWVQHEHAARFNTVVSQFFAPGSR
jgi:pimeloyl-ACP methyl ester carboxylesterase